MTLEGDCQNLKSMVQHTKETTHINSCYDIFQTNKEAYQPCSEIHIDYAKALGF